MSLQRCPHCHHKISWGKLYKQLHTKGFKNSHIVKCPNCGHKLGFEKQERSILHKVAVSLLWLAIPIVLIALVFTGRLDAIWAILLVIFYHFIAMHIIIAFYKYTSIKK